MTPYLIEKPENSTLFIVGTIRNGEKTLRKDINRLSRATSIFSKRYIFIAESDSDDQTCAVLKRIENERNDFSFKSFGKLSDKMPFRTERISFCRNKCIDFVKEKSLEGPYFVLVADLDGINSKISEKSLLSCWNLSVTWTACTANRVGRYYDIFALRCQNWVEEDCFKQARSLANELSPEIARYLTTEAKMINIPKDHPPIKVTSAFGGIGLYHGDSYCRGLYKGLDDNGEETCEHVEFHKAITDRGGSIYINPAMISGGRKEFLGKNILRNFNLRI